MSALLGHNPIPIIDWKGDYRRQISSRIVRNDNANNDKCNLFRALPLKIYRREIGTANSCSTNNRTSVRIDELMQPNGARNTMSANPLVTVGEEIPKPSNRTETGLCVSQATCIADNARRRVRSSGMIRKKYDPATNEPGYYTNSAQYLASRARTFQQNQYSHPRVTDTLILPIPSLTRPNIYVPNGTAKCPKTQISAALGNNTFSYYWIDAIDTSSTLYDVDIPDGYYDAHDLTNAAFLSMQQNDHYIINKITSSREPLLKFAWNEIVRRIEIQLISTSTFSSNFFSEPVGVTAWTLSNYVSPNNSRVIVLDFHLSPGFSDLIGFAGATYYPGISGTTLQNARTTSFAVLSTSSPRIFSSYIPMVYKPSNSRFEQQGGVSASSMTQRRKYETICHVSNTISSVYGKQVANALAYGVSETTYTDKSKYGYPLKLTPAICGANRTEVTCRENARMFNG
jgi:hypothetical protein